MRSSFQARGQALILVIPSTSPVHDSLRLAGAERPGEVADTVEEALRVLDGRPIPGPNRALSAISSQSSVRR